MIVIVFVAIVVAGMLGSLVYLWDFSRQPARRAVPSGVGPAFAPGAPRDGDVRTGLRAQRRGTRRALVGASSAGRPAGGRPARSLVLLRGHPGLQLGEERSPCRSGQGKLNRLPGRFGACIHTRTDRLRGVARHVRRAFKYRFYPAGEQAAELACTFGCVRLVYNKALEDRTRAWNDEKRRISYPHSSAALTWWK